MVPIGRITGSNRGELLEERISPGEKTLGRFGSRHCPKGQSEWGDCISSTVLTQAREVKIPLETGLVGLVLEQQKLTARQTDVLSYFLAQASRSTCCL